MRRLEAAVRGRFGGTDVLMNNAGVQPGSGVFGPAENWRRVLGVNLWGVMNGTQAFVPWMVERGRPGLVVNTGSKQGITTPPGDPAYNVSKAGVKAFTAAVLGGIGSLPGAVLGGLLIGLIETFWSAYFSVQYKDVAAFSILVLTLIFLPTGLLGRQEVEKV